MVENSRWLGEHNLYDLISVENGKMAIPSNKSMKQTMTYNCFRVRVSFRQ